MSSSVSFDPVTREGVSAPEGVRYAEHLAHLAGSQKLVAAVDLFDVDGGLIALRGSEVDESWPERVRARQLSIPLEHALTFERTIGPDEILNTFSRTRENHPDLDTIHQRLGIEFDFMDHVLDVQLPTCVWQGLTILFERRIDWFELAVLGAWWSLMIAKEAGFVDAEVRRALVAGLSRDLGFLHMDMRQIDRPGFIEGGSGEWVSIKSHVIIGERLWRMAAEGDVEWNAKVARAVFEHHERTNGIGYPRRPQGEELDAVGQIVGLADLLASVRLRRFAKTGHNIRDALPLILVSADCFSKASVDAAVNILNRSRLQSTRIRVHATRDQMVESMLSRFNALRAMVKALQSLPSFEPLVAKGRTRPPPHYMTRAVSSTLQMLLRSGVSDPELAKWVDAVRNRRSTAREHELCEIDLQQTEAIWRVDQIRKLLQEYVSVNQTRPNSPVSLTLKQLDLAIEDC
ncbi:MAG: hypothetical protein HC923_04435 [Myxococcales bacterium]|nr:hypothetical protein [Myxococcales bacterium]